LVLPEEIAGGGEREDEAGGKKDYQDVAFSSSHRLILGLCSREVNSRGYWMVILNFVSRARAILFRKAIEGLVFIFSRREMAA